MQIHESRITNQIMNHEWDGCRGNLEFARQGCRLAALQAPRIASFGFGFWLERDGGQRAHSITNGSAKKRRLMIVNRRFCLCIWFAIFGCCTPASKA